MAKLLVCDLDNTLYDWVGYFVPSFDAMVSTAVDILRCDREVLLSDLRTVHQKHSDSEHPYSLLETETVRKLYPGLPHDQLKERLDPAFHAFNVSRKRHLSLYDGVLETLAELRASGVRLVAHTEGKLFSVVGRMERLGLTEYFSHIYCRERSVHLHFSDSAQEKWLERFPMRKVMELSSHRRKPNADVLREICQREGIDISDASYVGDSVARDIMMAKEAGVTAIWAEYGTRHRADEYEALVRVSHWTQEDVLREKELKLKAKDVRPDYILKDSFSEILDFIDTANYSGDLVRHGTY